MAILDILIDWSRAQFALTACYHWLFVPLTLGLAVIMGLAETFYYVKKDEFWKHAAMFWQKLFGINFAIGVATGLILEFQFGTNWSNYSWFVGDIFGAPLAVEAIVAFFLEATFLPLMFFGWKKLSKGMHLAATWLGGLGATISAWWILVANAWMQYPVGMQFNPDTVRNEMVSFAEVALSPMAIVKFFHTVSSAWMLGAVFVIGVSSWFLLKGKNVQLAKRSIKLAVPVGLLAFAIVAFTGDQSGVQIAKLQPMKLAAAEGLEKGGQGVPFTVVPGVEVPKVLSILATHDINGFVPGYQDIIDGYTLPDGTVVEGAQAKMARGTQALADLKNYRALKEAGDTLGAKLAAENLQKNMDAFGYGHIKKAEDLVPPIGLTYWSFRLMIGCASLCVLFMFLFWWYGRKDQLEAKPWLLKAGMWSVLLIYISSQAGWIVAEVGRQPWIIQDMLPVNAAVSQLPVMNVVITFVLFLLIFTALLIAEVKIMTKVIQKHQS